MSCIMHICVPGRVISKLKECSTILNLVTFPPVPHYGTLWHKNASIKLYDTLYEPETVSYADISSIVPIRHSYVTE